MNKAANQAELDRIRWDGWIKGVTQSAQEAWASGRTFHVVRLNLGGTEAGFMSHSSVVGDDAAGALQAIEGIGWRLDDSGYVYQPLKERSHGLTDSAHMTGNIVGIYTFRRPPPMPPVP